MSERRKFPRIEKSLSIKLSDNEFDILTETKNISANGAYCPVRQPLPLMTKLDVVLLIPVAKNRSRAIKKLHCKGVVVRQEEARDNGTYSWRVAIYFNEIKETDRKMLAAYVDSFQSSLEA